MWFALTVLSWMGLGGMALFGKKAHGSMLCQIWEAFEKEMQCGASASFSIRISFLLPLGMLLHVFAVLQVKNKTFQRLAGGRCFPLSAREQPRKHCLKNITKDPPLISKF